MKRQKQMHQTITYAFRGGSGRIAHSPDATPSLPTPAKYPQRYIYIYIRSGASNFAAVIARSPIWH